MLSFRQRAGEMGYAPSFSQKGSAGLHPDAQAYVDRLQSTYGHAVAAPQVLSRFSGEVSGLGIDRAYFMGSDINLPAGNGKVEEYLQAGRALDYTGGGDTVLTVSRGLLNMDGSTANAGFLVTEDSSSVFDNSDWTVYLLVQHPVRDVVGGTNSYYWSQYPGFASGRFYITANADGDTVLTVINGTPGNVSFVVGNNPSRLGMFYLVLTYENSTRTITMYDGHNLSAPIGSSVLPAGGFAAVPTRFGHLQQAGSFSPLGVTSAGLAKFTGVHDAAQRTAGAEACYKAFTARCDVALLLADSVGDDVDAKNESPNESGAGYYPITADRMLKKNCLCARPEAMGGKTYWWAREDDFVADPATLGRITSLPPQDPEMRPSAWYSEKPNIIIFGDTQNTFAYNGSGGEKPFVPDFSDIVDHIVAKLSANRHPDKTVVAIASTALAWRNGAFGGPESQATCKNVSADIRALGAGRFAAAYDIYGLFNRREDNPFGDDPNGDPALFFVDDQHPNVAGHAAIADLLELALDQVTDKAPSSAPAAPSVLSATGAAGKIDLAWTDNDAGLAHYVEINRSPTGAFAGEETTIVWVPPATGVFGNQGIAPATTYFYRARAVNIAGASAWSNTDSATAT